MIQDLPIRNTEFLVSEVCQMSHLGLKGAKQSYGSKRCDNEDPIWHVRLHG